MYKKEQGKSLDVSFKMKDQEEALVDWLKERLRYDDVPRVSDAREYVIRQGLKLKLKDIKRIMRLQDSFMMSMPQQRQPKRDKKYRPIVVNNLGQWHADIGYFARNKRYETPTSYRAGYLVAKDVLSRYVYATPLIKDKSAESIIKAFQILFADHYKHLPDVPITSISFDQETSVKGNKVQAFLEEQNIKFHKFQMSNSKAKFAEGAVRQIRSRIAKLMRRNIKTDRWWNLLPKVVDSMNKQPVVVDGKSLRLAPKDVNSKTLVKFRNRLHKAVPAYYWAQFDIALPLVNFKYSIGTKVRAKLIAVSSEVLGKRSEVNLSKELFVIKEKKPYYTRAMGIGKAYKCIETRTGRIEVFQEDEITPSREEDLDPADIITQEDEEFAKTERPKRKATKKYK